MNSSLLFSVLTLLPAPVEPPVTLARTFVSGERAQYRVQATMQKESRIGGLETWMPENLTLKYDFTTVVEKLKTDGIAQVRYRRPSLLQIEDTGDGQGPQRSTEKLGWDLRLQISPLNKTIESKDVPKSARWMSGFPRTQEDPFGPFIGEVYRLATFVGGIDISLDLAPPLPIREVSVGDTWRSTVSFQPQRLKGQNELAVQRLDYVYTYRGIKTVQGKRFYRIDGSVRLDTDLAPFFHEIAETDADESGLKRFPLKLTTLIEFDLDLKTLRTVAARARSQGGFQIFGTDDDMRAVAEERFKGSTTMSLIQLGKEAPSKRTLG